MKILKWIVIVIVLLVIGAVGLLYANLDRIVKSTVESQGTEQLHVPTTLESVSLGLFSGTVNLSNLAVGSPKGFSAPQMLSLGGLAVDTGGLMKLRNEPIHVSSIRIDQPKLVIEQANGKLNFKELMDGLPSNPDKNAPPSTSSGKQSVRLIIDDLTVNGATVVIRPGLPGLQQEISLQIPQIDVKNIGNADGAENGAAIKDVVSTVITQMTAKAADSNQLPPEVQALLSGNLGAIRDKLTASAQAQLNKVATQLQGKIPANVSGQLNGLLKQGGGQNGSGSGNSGKAFLNQGLNMLKGATSQPGK